MSKSVITMSTNTDPHIPGVPDAAWIEKLANELFSALPGEAPKPVFSPHLEDHPRMQKMLNIVAPGFTAVPATQDGFEMSDPQTSLVDPHFADGQVPPSATGVGVSPAGAAHSYTPSSQEVPPAAPGYAHPFEVNDVNFRPYQFDHRQEVELKKILSAISQSEKLPQIPVTTFHGTDPAYYFLQNTPQHISQSPGISGFDVDSVRKDFPVFNERVNGKPLIWLDNAATTQKPRQVIDRVSYFYEHENSNIHRAAHELAARATDAYEGAREKVRQFLNAGSVNEIVFVRGTTEAINLVAKTWGDQNLVAGDEIILSHLEHHANIVPWKQLADKKGLTIKVIPVDDDGQILLDQYAQLLTHRTKLVSFTQVSNALGTVTPARQVIEMAHSAGAKVLLDGAQSVSHLRSDVRGLNCDWFVFSGHKVFGPTGIGVLYGKEDLLNATQPWQGGGNMIVDVTFEHIQYHKAPSRFEAGTGNIADAVGLGAAIDYVNKIGIDVIHQYEHYLLEYATSRMRVIPGLRLIGTAKEKASVLSFVFEGFRTEEVGAALNQEGIAVRSGHHCAQPILRRFGLETTVRPSLAFYNTTSEVDVLVDTLYRLRRGRIK
jgi:cysteine desulfurase/selenocysteine lyase